MEPQTLRPVLPFGVYGFPLDIGLLVATSAQRHRRHGCRCVVSKLRRFLLNFGATLCKRHDELSINPGDFELAVLAGRLGAIA